MCAGGEIALTTSSCVRSSIEVKFSTFFRHWELRVGVALTPLCTPSHTINECLKTSSSHTSNACWKTFLGTQSPTTNDSSEEEDDEAGGPAEGVLVNSGRPHVTVSLRHDLRHAGANLRECYSYCGHYQAHTHGNKRMAKSGSCTPFLSQFLTVNKPALVIICEYMNG